MVPAAVTAHAGVTIVPLVLEGDGVRGIGAVTGIESIAVTDSGSWMIEIDTDFIDTNQDGVILRDGSVAFREGQKLSVPVGATIDSFDSVHLSPTGFTGWNLFLDNVPGNMDSGIFYEDQLLIQESEFSTAAGFSRNTPYIGFFEVRMDSANRLFVVASVDDLTIPSSVDRALVRIDFVPATGEFSETLLAKEGDGLPGQTETVVDFGTGPENVAINDVGGMLYSASLTGSTGTNAALYLNDTLIAQKGGESSIEGRTYMNIGTSTRLDVNDVGETVFNVTLSGDTASDLALVRDGTVFVQEGDSPAATDGAVISSFGTAPVRIDNSGRVVWYANLAGDTTTNAVIARDQDVVARKGVTQVDGMTLTTIAGSTATSGITKGFSISPNGKHVIFRGILNQTIEGAFLATFDDDASPDLNGDGNVDAEDLAILLGAWETVGADLNGDGTTDAADLAILLGAWTS
ncbi:MAG: dockerin type I repeat-containing protein [Phycisphaerae bacterium]|nr:dockerin type I repeat-containing protein [Phycisphaerae bacterium]